ncbi:hypothetical protein GQ53DRAFT_888841 [Thozetella sp. PMI_491]|nr:hypothetical protein GQ53DRAFT_888841 [Thozetella sp. PMI_491]
MSSAYLENIVNQSSNINFSEWVSLFTLCLAPLIVHVLAGAPEPSYLCKRRPKWHDRICHYNPTSIFWRYSAVTDRRIRAKQWNRIDMATSNALLWTDRGWDGSEEIALLCMDQCVHLPETSSIGLLSREMATTWVVTLQGAQAVYLVIGGYIGGSTGAPETDTFIRAMALDTIFFPIAAVGLVRLCAARWLTQDFLFTAADPNKSISSPRRDSLDSLLESPTQLAEGENRFRSASWASTTFRALLLMVILGLWTISVLYLCVLYFVTHVGFTMTSFLTTWLYLVVMTTTVATFSYYFVRGNKSTIIPCIGSTWYKGYTLTLASLALIVIIVAAIETRRTPCGKYTSDSGLRSDFTACWTRDLDIVPLHAGEIPSFGLATTQPGQSLNNETTLNVGEFWVYNFTGLCLGRLEYRPFY